MKLNYQARTKKGEIHTGQVEASSKEAAINLLQKHGLYVTFLEEAIPPIYAQRVKFFETISKKDVVLFSRQLAIMFKSKVPLVESLKVLSSQTGNFDFKEKIIKISEEVEGGTSLSQAMARYPKIFSPFYIAMVKSGEVSGKLSEVLNYLADHLERDYHLMNKARGALLYPSLIVFVVLLVMGLLVFFVIPQLTGVLESGGQTLPVLTRVVIGVATFLRNWGWLLVLTFIVFLFFCFRYYQSDRGKKYFDSFFLRIPMVGGLLKMVSLTRFAENLSTLIAGGLPIAQALETVADIIGNVSYKEIIIKARDEVRKGEPVSAILNRRPELFPPVFIQMVLVGEKTGTLDATLMNIVDFYQKEIDRSIDNILSVLEPVLIVVLGVIVAGLMLSILMPLYRMIAI
ncbi:MAG: type II secretion system F family protein [Candidatus Pacebacteria bacterium]|nr:type II secretion system F family protein [Candidatus Paceibacterota bacterium]